VSDTTIKPADLDARVRIRDDHAATLFVEAGAGTGKTTALVARVVELVATGGLLDIAGLAAITFTENAAAELRNRIREGLEQAARGRHRDRGYDEAERERCRQTLPTFDDAAVTTLHGFAARILTDFPIEAGLSPGFTIREPIAARLESLAAWRGFLDQLLDDASVQPHLLAGLTLDLKLDALHTLADAFSSNWDLLLDRPFRVTALPTIDIDAVRGPLARAAAYADIGPANDALTAWLGEFAVPAVAELGTLTDPLDQLEALHRLSVNTSSGDTQKWKRAGLSKTDVIAHLKQAEAARDDVVAGTGHAVAETFAGRIQEHVLEKAANRQQKGGLDFHDLLVLTRNLLRDNGEVRNAMHDRYPVVLIDEFQDTDPLQIEIACLIAGDCADEPTEAWSDTEVPDGRLFFVGDPKQSIYRFRRADVGVYLQAGQCFASGETRLQVSFRAVPGVIAAVNAAFEDLIGKTTRGQVPYSPIVAHREPTSVQPPVLLLGGPVDGNAPQLRDAEAEHIAATITRAKREHWPIEGGTASYRDVAILLPTRTSLPAIESALQAQDIPYRVESRSLVWATDAVRDLITFLQALDNPADEVATVAALRHPGLACSDVHLAEWAAAGGRWNYLAPPPEGLSADHPVAAGMTALRRYHDLRWWLPVNELIDRIVRELRLVELTAGLRRPRDHWRRLRFLVDQARAFCDQGGSGLGDFVAWAVDQIDSDADVLETVVPEPDDDAVRILTVHGSKGLEFPVTIVAGLGFSLRSGAQILWGGPQPKARLRKGLESSGYAAQAQIEKALDDAEAVRLLYVAMTRARDHLVLGCYHKPTKSGWRSYAQQLWRLLGAAPTLARVETVAPEVAAVDGSHDVWALSEVDRDAFVSERQRLIEAVSRRVATSATALTAAQDSAATAGPEPVIDASPDEQVAEVAGSPVLRRTVSRGGAALGTAVHRVLELVDLESATYDEVRRLAEVAAAEQEIPALASYVTSRVMGALQAPIVQEAAQTGRYWREVYVVVPDGERFVEGYIDLLVETGDGELVVVDYKTDRVDSDTELVAKVEHYRPQLSAYARAISRATGRPVGRGVLVFARPGTALEHDVALDLSPGVRG